MGTTPRGIYARYTILVGMTITWLAESAAGQALPPREFTVAFIGDQGLGSDAEAVLQLIHGEGADAVVHSGDFDYDDDPKAWDAMISRILGPDFPYFASAGNHDDGVFYGPGGYQEVLAERMGRLGLAWDGDLGVRSSHHFQGVFFVLTAPGIFDGGDGDVVYAPYIAQRLAADRSAWRISSWHVLMEAMQVGGKSDESGWGVYEASRHGGAIIATGHEHSYARTHPLTSCIDRTVASTFPTFDIARDDPRTIRDDGVTFAFHNGLGGASIRDQERCFPIEPPYGCDGEWASIYTSDQGADDGALFGVFNVFGHPCLAQFYFKDVQGNQPDGFLVRSTMGPCAACPEDLNLDGAVSSADLVALLAAWGLCPVSCAADLDGDGLVGAADLLALIVAWGPCG